jgi:hypothetical protein
MFENAISTVSTDFGKSWFARSNLQKTVEEYKVVAGNLAKTSISTETCSGKGLDTNQMLK